MPIPITSEIKAKIKLDDTTARLLRTLDLEWGCACRLLKRMLDAGFDTGTIASALQVVLPSYQRMCRERVSEHERLQTVLGHVYQSLKRTGNAPTPEQTALWCKESFIPSEVAERLIHG
ncbi:hypothetical protein [Aquipseudomonas alcaligenes]|uniref:Uncharacterized protein n=1 Tax=Aquipseudomonas alcaligenes TaxID=43263 RepID=A0A1N6XE06_AQUAC|nr:hypothetical protein [Pseudomonas alcaligenes]SIR00497.1 hypothetical protein SAMN05878282_112101 [Pseudomonas alcaligenes]